MTWAKFGTEFYSEFDNYDFDSDLFVYCESMHNRAITKLYEIGRMELTFKKRQLNQFYPHERAADAAAELVRLGLWEDCGDRYRVKHHEDVVRSSLTAQEKKRDKDKAYQRKRRGQGGGESSPESVEPVKSAEPEPVTSWNVADIPSGPVDESTGELFDAEREAQIEAFNSPLADRRGSLTPMFHREAV